MSTHSHLKPFQRFQLRMLGFYPPYLGAGIGVQHVGVGHFRVRMKLRFWNQNLFGTHFGGSLYSMCDPFFTLCLVEKLGPGWIVWDKAATIRFRKPGRGTVEAEFRIPDERVEEIRRDATEKGRTDSTFAVDVVDEEGDVVAALEKVVFVKPKG